MNREAGSLASFAHGRVPPATTGAINGMSAIAGRVTPITERVRAADGTELFMRHWPAQVPGWASALIVHGLAEHSGRYEHVGSHLAEAGIDTFALDQRGFGQSGGERAWVDRWSRFHDDLQGRVEAIRASHPGQPLLMYGHSLGGLLVLGYVLTEPDPGGADAGGPASAGRPLPDALVLSAPAMAATLPAAQRLAVNVLGRLAPRFRVANGIATETLSSIPAVREDYLADPLNEHRSYVGFGLRGFREQGRVVAALAEISVPTLVIHGGLDRLVPVASSAVLEGHPRVTRRVYDGLAHELHNEPQADQVLDDVVAWAKGALPARGAA